jgi:hypothetical protein
MGREDSVLEDMKMVSHLSNHNIESFANENNVWRSRHLQMENMMESEMQRQPSNSINTVNRDFKPETTASSFNGLDAMSGGFDGRDFPTPKADMLVFVNIKGKPDAESG